MSLKSLKKSIPRSQGTTKQKSVRRSKKHSRTSPDVQFKEFYRLNRKLDLKRTKNGLGKTFRKKIRSKKLKKNSKNQSEIAACEQKTTSEKANFCSNTVFSLYFEFREKNSTPQNHSLFRSTSCFGVTKITTPI